MDDGSLIAAAGPASLSLCPMNHARELGVGRSALADLSSPQPQSPFCEHNRAVSNDVFEIDLTKVLVMQVVNICGV